MRNSFWIVFIVTAAQKLVSSVFKICKRNSTDGNNEEIPQPESSIERKQRLLKGFDENDMIYEEFDPSTNLDRAFLLGENDEGIIFDKNWRDDAFLLGENDEGIIFHNNWRDYLPHGAMRWLLKCFFQSFNMVVLCSLFVSALSVIIMYVDINTAEVCFQVQWDNLPEKLIRVRVTMEVIKGWLIQLFHIGVMISVFGLKLVDELRLLHLNVVAAFVDSVYRLLFQVYGNYGWKGKSYILNAIFVAVMTVNSYTLGKHFSIQRARKFKLTMQLGVQFMLGSTLMLYNVYQFGPWFLTLGRFQKTIVAAVVPIFGSIIKLFTCLTIQDIHINHPGTPTC